MKEGVLNCVREGVVHIQTAAGLQRSVDLLDLLALEEKFSARQDLPKKLILDLPNGSTMELDFETSEEKKDRRIHTWVVGKPGTYKTLATNKLTEEYRAIKAPNEECWPEMNGRVQLIVHDEFVQQRPYYVINQMADQNYQFRCSSCWDYIKKIIYAFLIYRTVQTFRS